MEVPAHGELQEIIKDHPIQDRLRNFHSRFAYLCAKHQVECNSEALSKLQTEVVYQIMIVAVLLLIGLEPAALLHSLNEQDTFSDDLIYLMVDTGPDRPLTTSTHALLKAMIETRSDAEIWTRASEAVVEAIRHRTRGQGDLVNSVVANDSSQDPHQTKEGRNLERSTGAEVAMVAQHRHHHDVQNSGRDDDAIGNMGSALVISENNEAPPKLSKFDAPPLNRSRNITPGDRSETSKKRSCGHPAWRHKKHQHVRRSSRIQRLRHRPWPRYHHTGL